MHYCDELQLKMNSLDLVIYIHEPNHDVQITSIQGCQYFRVGLLKSILRVPNQLIENVEYKTEEWYLVKIQQTDWDDWEIISFINVSNHEDEFLRLH